MPESRANAVDDGCWAQGQAYGIDAECRPGAGLGGSEVEQNHAQQHPKSAGAHLTPDQPLLFDIFLSFGWVFQLTNRGSLPENVNKYAYTRHQEKS